MEGREEWFGRRRKLIRAISVGWSGSSKSVDISWYYTQVGELELNECAQGKKCAGVGKKKVV